MAHMTLITASELSCKLTDPGWLVVDCRFYLAEPGKGRQEYLEAHIPGAVYAHLDEDLTAPNRAQSLSGGRHPLPLPEPAAESLGRLGIGQGMQVVAYDAAGGALAAARLWWLLRWLGHAHCAVLDGGWQGWLAAEHPVANGTESRPTQVFKPRVRSELIVSASQVDAMRQDKACRVLDARAYERFQGKNETIDPVAGHIPGAYSAPYQANLKPDLSFRSKNELRQMYLDLLGNVPAERSAVYCGSGVTAAHSVLAILHAGLGEARLYPGSWSEWISDPSRPVAVGESS